MRPAGVFLLWVVILCGTASAEVTVWLTEPGAGLPIFGEVEVVAEARGTGEAVVSVEVFLDGRSVGKLARPLGLDKARIRPWTTAAGGRWRWICAAAG